MAMGDARRPLSPVAQSALSCIAERGLAASGRAPLVLMVSGGSDSTAMALVMRELVVAGEITPAHVAVLHVNHGLRGEDAEQDGRFVRKLAGLCGFSCKLADIDIPTHLSEFGNNIESAGRYLRYREAERLLDDSCDMLGFPCEDGRIWVAHTQDDRVETFFMRAIVGTGPGGLAGMDYRNGRIVRPLMHTSREQLRAYILEQVDELGWELDEPRHAQAPRGCWREDHTNHEDDGFRAFVRNNIVPLAAERNPSLGQTMGRMCDLLLAENAFVEAQVDELRERATRMVDGCVAIDARILAGTPEPLASRLVHEACKMMLPVAKRIESQHVLEMVRRADDPSFSLDAPGGISAWHELGSLMIGPGVRRRGEVGALGEHRLDVPGELSLPGGRILRAEHVRAERGVGLEAYARKHADEACAFVDADRLGSRLLVTGPRAGERMCPLGMGGSRKLVLDVLAEARVPCRLRYSVPIVHAGDSVVWACGARVDERFRVTAETSRLVRLSIG